MSLITTHPHGNFCWVELATTDQTGAKAFYAQLFGWAIQDQDMGPDGLYTIFKLKNVDAAAAYTLHPQRMAGVPPHWTLYVAVDDADASATRCVELGGAQIAPPFNVHDLGRMAMMKDPSGAAHVAWQGMANPGIGIAHEVGALCWGELNTTDTTKAKNYYSQLFGWELKTGNAGGMEYTEILQNGKPIGGIADLPPGVNAPPHWLPYFGVSDCDATAAQVVALGGKVILAPLAISEKSRIAVMLDPQGAVFAVYQE